MFKIVDFFSFQVRFGTLNDYFRLVHERLREDKHNLPVLSGDFFTYADRNDHYWSGLFFLQEVKYPQL